MDSFGILAYFLWCESRTPSLLFYGHTRWRESACRVGGGFRNADEVAALYKEIMSAVD